jgi:hypothetical protein
VAELFALIVFHCDNFLTITPSAPGNNPSVRFFNIAKRLPMELQMMLCYHVFGSAKENILLKDSEPAFKTLAKRISDGILKTSSFQ